MKLNTPNFSSKWHIFCQDESSKKERQYIREHLEEPLKDDEIKNSGRLDEYELNQLVKSLILTKPVFKKEPEENPEINYELLKNAGLSNFKPLYGNNSFRAGLNDLTKKQLETVKQAGIKHIVDLRKWGETIHCDGIDVFNFPILDINQNITEMYEGEYIEKELCNKLVKFIQTMQKENVLIGCEYGTYTTDCAIQFNYFLNPKADIMLNSRNKQFGITLQTIYESLSQEDKEAMGWDSEFDKNFINKLERYGYWVD